MCLRRPLDAALVYARAVPASHGVSFAVRVDRSLAGPAAARMAGPQPPRMPLARRRSLRSWCWLAVLCGACMPHPRPPADAFHALVDREWTWRMQRVPAAGEQRRRARRRRPARPRRRRRPSAGSSSTGARSPWSSPRCRGPSCRPPIGSARRCWPSRSARISAIEHRAYLMPINGDSGFFVGAANLPRVHTSAHRRRLRALPRAAARPTALLRREPRADARGPRAWAHRSAGRSRRPRRRRAGTRRGHRSRRAACSTRRSRVLPGHDRRRRPRRGCAPTPARRSSRRSMPAYARVARFLAETYIPGARTTIAASDLPDGRAFYRAAIRDHLTRDMTPEAVRDIGLREVARITRQMEAIKQRGRLRRRARCVLRPPPDRAASSMPPRPRRC